MNHPAFPSPTVADVLALAARDGAIKPSLTWKPEGKTLVARVWSNPPDGEPKVYAALAAKLPWQGAQTAKTSLLLGLAVGLAHALAKCSCTGKRGAPCPAGLTFLRSLATPQAA